jgi:hypothetical protein
MREAHEQRLSERGLWKTRMKSGENAFHRVEVSIRYAAVEHSSLKSSRRINEWQQA